MKSAAPDMLPGSVALPEALIREARSRQRRRWLAAGLAVGLVLAGVAAVVAGAGAAGQRPSGAAATTGPAHAVRPVSGLRLPGSSTTVLMWPVGYPVFSPVSGAPAELADLGTGRLVRRQIPGIAGCDCQPYVISVGRRLVYVAAAGTAAVSADLQGRPAVLGKTLFFAPSAAPGHVLLVRFHGSLGQAPVRTWSVPVSGGPGGPAITLPTGANMLIRGTAAGLLLQGRPGRAYRLALWTPGSTPRNLPYSPADGISDGFDATSRLVAYGSGCRTLETAQGAGSTGYDLCRILRVLNVVTGRLRSFGTPPGTAGWVPHGFNRGSAISPGGQMVAAYALTGSPSQGQARLYLARLSGGGRVAAVPSSAVRLSAGTAWTANGAWLLYQGPGDRLRAYQAATGKSRGSRAPCCQYTVMIAAPSRSG